MDIKEFLFSHNAMIVVSASDLKQFATELIAAARIDAVKQLQAQQQEEKYLTRKETAERLHVDISTLHRWKNMDYLCPIKVGSKVRYRLSDVKKLERGEL